MRPRTAGVAGIVSAVSFVVGLMIIKLPGGPDTDAEVIQWFRDGHHAQQYIGGYLLLVAALALLLFSVGLSRTLRTRDAEPGDVRGVATLVAAAGSASATLIAALAATVLAMIESITLQDDGKPSATLIPIGWIGVGLLAVMFVPLAVAMVAAAFDGRRTAMFPGWFLALSLVAAVALVASIAFVTMIFFPIWMIVASALLLRRSPG